MAAWRLRPGSRTRARPPSLRTSPHDRTQLIDEDAELRSGLAALNPAARRELGEVLAWPESRRDALLHSLLGRASAEPLCQLIAIADADEVARLRLLRAIRDLERTPTN